MYKVIIWGLGKGYAYLRSFISKEIKKGNIEIISFIDADERKWGQKDGVEVSSPDALQDLAYDYIIIAVTGVFYDQIHNELTEKGIDESKIINGMDFASPKFDFVKYIENGRELQVNEEQGADIISPEQVTFSGTYAVLKDEVNFYQYMKRPIMSEGYNNQEDYDTDFSEIAIVMQGPILKEFDFTYESIKMYLSRYPGIHIIVSTWKNETEYVDNKLRELPIQILLLEEPNYPGLKNINYQVTSSREGIKKAQELGCKYALKIRNDARVYSGTVFSEYISLLDIFAVKRRDKLSPTGRIICQDGKANWCCFVVDFWFFGNTSDMLRLFEAPIIENEENDIEVPPESYLGMKYLECLGEEVEETNEYSERKFAEYFLFRGAESLSLYWPKYGESLSLPMDSDSFSYWLRLYRKYCS